MEATLALKIEKIMAHIFNVGRDTGILVDGEAQ